MKTFSRAAALGAAFFCAAAQASGLSCETDPGLRAERVTERIVLVGETHGTEQAPAFVARLVCGLLQQHKPVILALERDEAEWPATERFLASSGSADPIGVLLNQPGWSAAIQDGRSSAAMLGLLEQVRQWRQAGQPVELLLMVRRETGRSDPMTMQARYDAGMADTVTKALGCQPGHVAVVFAGTFHTAVGSAMHQEAVGAPSMGDLLAARLPVHVIGLSHSGGESWVCTPKRACGPAKMIPSPFDLPDARVDTRIELGRITASAPAKAGR